MDDEKKQFMRASIKKLIDFLEALMSTDVWVKFAEGAVNQGVKDDIERIKSIAEAILKEKYLSSNEIDNLESLKTTLVKGKGSFHSGMTIYPLGSYIIEQVNGMINQHRQDQLLQAEIEAAAESAKAIKSYTKDTILKGDDIMIPGAVKFSDMVVKYHNFIDNVSPEVQAIESNKECLNAIKSRIDELRTALYEVIQDRFNQTAKPLHDALLHLSSRGLTEESSTLLGPLLKSLVAFNPLQKTSITRILGKSVGADYESALGSLQKVCKALEDVLPQLVALVAENFTEATLMNKALINLFAVLHDEGALQALLSVAPVMHQGVLSLKKYVKSRVTSWLSKTAATFQKFIGLIMQPEIDLNDVLKIEAVGAVDAEDKEGKNIFDFSNLCTAYVRHFPLQKTKVVVSMGNEAEVHVAFLCFAGCLVQLSKYILHFEISIQEVGKKLPFVDVAAKHFETDCKADMNNAYKMSTLSGLTGLLKPLSSMMTAFAEMFKQVAEGINLDSEKFVFEKLVGRCSSNMTKILNECSQEIISGQSSIHGLFSYAMSAHPLASIFKTEKTDRALVVALLGDPKVKQLIFVGSKLGNHMKEISAFLSMAKSLPGVCLSNLVSSLLTAVESDLGKFAGAKNPMEMPSAESGPFTLGHFSWFQGSTTLVQVLTRELQPGETRLGLITKCTQLLEKMNMGCEPCLKSRALQISLGK